MWVGQEPCQMVEGLEATRISGTAINVDRTDTTANSWVATYTYSDGDQATVNVTLLPTGIYLLRATGQWGSAVRKFTIKR